MKLKKSEIEKITVKYNIGNIISHKKLKGGLRNLNYLIITPKGKYVLRLYGILDPKENIKFIIELSNYIKNPLTPNYIKDTNNKYINSYKRRNYTIYKYLEGETPKKLTKQLNTETAYFLAKYHIKVKDFQSNIDKFAFYKFSDKRIQNMSKDVGKNLGKFKNEFEDIKIEMLENKIPNQIPQGVLHCDVKRMNILAKGNKLSGILDFDNCHIGPLILDLSKAIIWLCSNKEGLDYKKTYNFVRDYEKYRKLTKEEKKNLFTAIRYACLSHMLVDYHLYAIKVTPKSYFEFIRTFFSTLNKSLDQKRFNKYVLSPFARINKSFI